MTKYYTYILHNSQSVSTAYNYTKSICEYKIKTWRVSSVDVVVSTCNNVNSTCGYKMYYNTCTTIHTQTYNLHSKLIHCRSIAC